MKPRGAVLFLFAGTLLLSSLLLFLLQPMITKIVLPLFGGSPAVWNTAIVFFQTTLLAGYLYAHIITRLLAIKAQILLHGALLVVTVTMLPIEAASGWAPPPGASPTPWLIALLALSIGLPFATVSTSAPLMQTWFARSGHAAAGDPYFLYGASNLGSLAALIGYPTLIEPYLGLRDQGWGWAGGFVLLAVCIGLCAMILWHDGAPNARHAPRGGDQAAAQDGLVDHLDWPLRLRWLLFAFVPASLLLGVTLHIGTNVSAAPFLWVAPLVIYLLSFVLVFSRRPLLKHRWMVYAQALLLIPVVLFFETRLLWLVFLLHLLALFVIAMVCHGELAKRRPTTRHLTEFYLWMSLGGALGGMFNGLIAPAVFDTAIEYPLVLVLACLLRPTTGREKPRQWAIDLALLAILATFVLARPIIIGEWADIFRGWHWEALRQNLYGIWLGLNINVDSIDMGNAGFAVFLLAAALILLFFHGRPLPFAVGIAILLFAGQAFDLSKTTLLRERSFFGILTVELFDEAEIRVLRHGTTVHGSQSIDALYSREPLTYYGRKGPLGQVIAALNSEGRLKHIGAVGLGVGTIACYRRPGQTLTFFEIDPLVERLARDRRYFSYLADCGEGVDVVLGDGRLSLAKTPDNRFDLIILDAYASDAIPVHLITREALALYLKKLGDGGVVMFNVSNKYVDLVTVLANLIADAGLVGRLQRYRPENKWLIESNSSWIAIARSPEDLAMLDREARWKILSAQPGETLWTDDYSNVFGALMWKFGLW